MSWDAPISGTRPAPAPDSPLLPGAPTPPDASSMPFLPEKSSPTSTEPTIELLGSVAPIVPDGPSATQTDASLSVPTTPSPKWKKRKKSKARRFVSLLITLAVLGALGAGAVFGYQAMNPPEEPQPSIPLRDRPDTIFGKTGDLVDGINEGMPDQELLDQVLGESPPNDDP